MTSPHLLLTTAHRRQRLALWALAVLGWIAGVVFGERGFAHRQLRQRHRRIAIERLTRLVVQLLIVRAFELAPVRARKLRFWRNGRDLKRRHFIRSLIGARLRRVLKPKGLAQRIANLMRVLRQLDAFARHLAGRRLTRLWAIAPAPVAAEALATLCAPGPAPADSS